MQVAKTDMPEDDTYVAAPPASMQKDTRMPASVDDQKSCDDELAKKKNK